MYKYYWTNSDEDYRQWDNFLSSTKRGHYLQLSEWLKSYKKYGFKSEVLIVKNENGKIIAGAGIVISKLAFLKFCSCSCGPIILEGYEDRFHEITDEILNRFKKYRPICGSINFPILANSNENIAPYCLDVKLSEHIVSNSYEGDVIKAVSSINGFREVKIKYDHEFTPEEHLLRQCNSNTKRNIKKAIKNNLSLRFAQTESEIKAAYDIIELNAQTQGYAVRTWNDFKDAILKMVKEGDCVIPTCFHQDQLKGALIVLNTGKRFTYISGGTIREEQDLKVGHFLHFEMLKLSIENEYGFYDISVGGSAGVTRFKEGFGGQHVKFINERYWVYNRLLFKIYMSLLPKLKKNKVLISRIIKFLK